MKLHDNRCKGKEIMRWIHVTIPYFSSYQCIVTLTFDLLTGKKQYGTSFTPEQSMCEVS